MLSQFPSSTSLLFHPALPPSQPRHPCPQCLAVATLISLKLLQKKKKKEKKTTKTSRHLTWKTQAHLYIAPMLVSSPGG